MRLPVAIETISNNLTIDEVIALLREKPSVDGIACFGSRTSSHQSAVSDYDLLIVMESPSVAIFQLLTHIDHRIADVVFISVNDVDRTLTIGNSDGWTHFQQLFMLKARSIQVVYDKSGRLARARHLALDMEAEHKLAAVNSYDKIYSTWFWQNHSLLHIKRMAQSQDSTYQIATDMMLLTALSSICKDYFILRSLPWEGEKAAIRYLQSYDPAFLTAFNRCIASQDRQEKIALYEQLVARAMSPGGKPWKPGVAAVMLVSPPQSEVDIDIGLRFWEELVSSQTVV